MTLNWTNIKSAIVYAFLTAILSMGGYVIGLGDIFKVQSHAIINIGVISALTAIVSILKSLLTNSQGQFMGVVQVK